MQGASALPDHLELRPSRLKWLVVLLVSAMFSGLGIVMFMTGQDAVMSALTAGFFGLGVVVSLLQLFSRTNGLVLHRDGFAWSVFGRQKRFGWDEVSAFHVWSQKQGFVTTSRHVGFTPLGQTGGIVTGIAKHMTGGSASLPDLYGLKADRLAALMNAFRARALQDGSGQA